MDRPVINISKSLLAKGDTLESLRFSYYADKDRFISAFAKHCIIINDGENDLVLLAELCKSGGDLGGVLKTKNGQRIFFSINNIMAELMIREERYLHSGIEFID